MHDSSDDFWWNDIAGPESFVKKVTDILLDRHVPLLLVPADIPWRHSMRNAVIERLTEIHTESCLEVFTIDALDECPENNIGEFLLQKFADRDTASAYRPRSGKTMQEYLTTQKVLTNKIIWVKGLSADQLQAWMDFCRQFETLSIENGIFIIENREPIPDSLPDIFQTVDFVQFVSHYDAMLFNSLLVSEKYSTLSRLRQGYISVAAAYLCEFDAELSESLLQQKEWFKKAPQDMLIELAKDETFIRRGERHGSPHVLTLLRENRITELSQRLWTAQIQVLFPILEMQRIKIIKRLYNKLQAILNTEVIEQFGQKVTTPYELEFGTLVFLMAKHDNSGNRCLYIPDETLRNAIINLRECRNLLAHRHQCCSPEQVDFILSFEEKNI